MHKAANILRVSACQLSQLVRGRKIWLVLICNFIFLQSQVLPLQSFLREYEADATPFLFPFLFMDPFLTACFFFGIILLFCNAPFFTSAQKFVAIRTGKKVWAAGQILYILCTGLLYFLALYLMSAAVLIPRLSLKNDWGSVWNTLARTEAGQLAGVYLIIPAGILNALQPLQTVALVEIIGTLNAVFLGELLFLFNVYWKKEAGIAVAAMFLLLPTRMQSVPAILRYLMPISWMALDGWSGDLTSAGTDLKMQILLLLGAIFLLGGFCILGCHRKEIPEIEE